MSEPKVLHEIGNSDYALVGDCLYPSIRGTTPCNPKNIRKLGGDAVVVAREVLRLAAENAELRGLLEEVDGLPESAQFPGDAHPVFYIPRDLRDRIRQALHREGE